MSDTRRIDLFARIALAVGALAIGIGFFLSPAAAYVTIGDGYGSKWGDAPEAGTGAIVTWGFMADGTGVDPSFRIDPFEHPDISGVVGTSNITQLRSTIDSQYGAGAFDAVIQSAFNTWSAVANITFVGPVADSGLPVDSPGATSPMIRIGAFLPDPDHWFKDWSSVGFGPPGPSGPDFFPLSGDVLFNLNGIGSSQPYQIATGIEDVDPVPNVQVYGDDVEGLFLHELGHAAIGLDHPRWDGETPDQRVMYTGDWDNPEAPFCCQTLNRQLHPDDIAGAQFVYGIRGDYNRDLIVDAADYVLWRDSVGQTTIAGTGADGNVDGVVNEHDYFVWAANFGTVGAVGTSIDDLPMRGGALLPEPATPTLLFAASISFVVTRRRRQPDGRRAQRQ